MSRLALKVLLVMSFAFALVARAQTTPVTLFGITKSWKYQQTTNFDGVNWMAPAYDDSSWPSGPALLYFENNSSVTPRNTPLTLGRTTYYFRTHFQFTNGTGGTSLVFSNLIDDGAVFFLNGVEVQRVRMPLPPAAIGYATLANALPPGNGGDASIYDVFTLSDDALTNMITGDNVLAVEVHQQSSGSSDIVWGTALTALIYTGPMTFVTQPTNVAVLDGRFLSLNASVLANPAPTYQWFKDGVPISGATNRSYDIAAAYPSHAGTYFLQASNTSGTLASSNAVVTIIDDFSPPLALSATGAKDLVTISIPFSEALAAASATVTNHFAVLPAGPGSVPVHVLSATLTNQTNVVLVTTPRTARADYLVHIEGVRDLSSRSNTLAQDLPLLSVVDLVTIDATTIWRFDDSGAEPPIAWAQQGFDDSGWSNGPALFYVGTQAGLLPEPARATLSLTNRADTNRVLTCYFRLGWDFPGDPATASLRLRYIVDDGAVFYLNGTEVHSVRMPTNRPLAFTNLAAASVSVAFYEPATNLDGVTLTISNLSAGLNLLAVEVHQGAATSSDIAFAATLEATIERFAPPVRLQIPGALSELAGVITNGGSTMLDTPLPTNLVVTLASSVSNSVLVPEMVLIPAGTTNASFDITVLDDNLLNGTRPVVLSARAPGYSMGRATLVLSDDEAAGLTLNLPASILEGTSAEATLSLDRPPVNATAIALISLNPALSVPAAVTVAPGATSVVFNITATDDALLNGTRSATVRAQFPNWTSITAATSVLDNESTNLVLTLPSVLTEADGVRTNAGRVSLLGVPSSNIVVALQSSSPGELGVLPSVLILAGQTNALFDVTVFNDASTNGTRSITVTASASGFANGSQMMSLYDDDPALITFSHIASPQYAGVALAATLTAHDITGRLLTNFNGSLALSAASPTGTVAVVPVSVGPFTNGRWGGSLTLPAAATFVRLSCPPLGSVSVAFHVAPFPVRTFPFPSQYILHSPLTQLIYASVPSFAPGNSNTITAFDPVGGTNVWSLSVGAIVRPQFSVAYRSGRITLAENGQHLFVAVSNAMTVRRIDLLSRAVTSSFDVGSGLSVVDMALLASSSSSLAIATANASNPGGVAIYDNGISRPDTTYFVNWINSIEPSPNPDVLYGYNGFASGFEFRRLSVTPTGVGIADTTSGLVSGNIDIVQAGGLVYAAPGLVVDPTNRTVLATLAPGGERIAPDAALGRAFIAGYSTTNYFIQAHDLKTFLPLKTLLIPPGGGTITDLIRYGSNGLAMHTSLDFLYLIESPLLFPSGPPADLQLTQSHSPEPSLLGSNLTFTVFVTNAGPADAFEATINDTLPANAVFLGATLTQGSWTNQSGKIRAELGYLPSGATAALTVTVRTTASGPLANRAFVVANENDTNLLNNVFTDTPYVQVNLAPDSYAPVTLSTRDLVFDPVTDRLYASIAGAVPVLGNQLVPVDPGNGVVEAGWNAGNEPGRLVLVPPGGKVYAAVNTNYLIRRINLASQAAELTFAINSNAPPTDYTVEDFAVLPGTPDALAVLRLQYGFNAEIAVYDQGVPRANVAFADGDNYAESIEASADGGSVYFQSYGVRGFRGYAVEAQGVSQLFANTSITPAFSTRRWKAVDTRLFGSDGVIIDPATPRIIATVPGISANAVACYDAGRGRFFYLTLSNTWVLCAFDARTLAPLQTLVVTNVLGTPSSLVRVRDDGFAFRTDTGQLFLMRASAAGHGATADLAVSAQAAVTNVILGSNFTITLTATNRGPGSASNVVLSLPAPVAATIVTASAPYTVYSSGRPGIKFNLGVFTNGASTSITVTLRTTEAGVLHALTAVLANAEDVNQSNNVATVEVLVVFPPGWSGVNFLPLPARDIAYDQGRNVFYISSGAETVAVVSPDSGEILASLFAGPATGRLKITDNGEFLYVTVSNGTAVARIDLASGTRDVLFDLGLTTFSNPYTVTDMEPVPGAAHSIVIGQGHPSEGYATVTIYDDGVARPLSPVDTSGADYLEFANATNQFHANGRGFSYRRYRTMEITANGVEEIAGTETVPTNLRDFEFAGGLFYATTGDILAPATGDVVGHINGLGTGTLVEPDDASGKICFVSKFGSEWRLLAFNSAVQTLAGSLVLSNVFGTPLNLIRWGTDGLAFVTDSNQLYLVKGQIASGPPADLALRQSASSTSVLVQSNATFSLTVSNAGPNSASNVLVGIRFDTTAAFVSASANQGTSVVSGATIAWSVGTLSVNGTATFAYALNPLYAGNLTVLAGASSLAIDPVLTNNATTNVVAVLLPEPPDSVGELRLANSALLYDPVSGQLFASTPANALVSPHSLVSINPATAALGQPLVLDSEPSKISITDDGQFLYAALNAGPAVRRVNLPAQMLDLKIMLATPASDLDAVPGSPHSFAIINRDPIYLGGNWPYLRVFDDAVPRALGAGNMEQFAVTRSNLLVGYNTFPDRTYQAGISAAGIVPVSSVGSLLGGQLKVSGGLVFASTGRIVDPDKLVEVATLPVTGLFEPDAPSRRVFFLTQSAGAWLLRAFELDAFTEINSIPIPGVLGTPHSLVRCGADRLAMGTSGGQVFIVRTGLIPSGPLASLAIGQTATPEWTSIGSNFICTLSLANSGPNTASNVVVSDRLPANATLVSASVSQGVISNSAGVILARLGSLAPGAAATLSITLQPTAAGSISNTAAITSTAMESNWADNVSVAVIAVAIAPAPDSYGSIELNATDLAYDPAGNRLYASGAGAGMAGRTLWQIGAEDGVIRGSLDVGASPNLLAAASDGSSLYVSFANSELVKRVSLPSNAVNLTFDIGAGTTVQDMFVVPGQPELLVASRYNLGGTPHHAGVFAFDSGVARSNSAPGHTGSNVIEPSADPAIVLGLNNESTEFGLRRMAVDASGIVVISVLPNAPFDFNEDFRFAANRLFTTRGRVINPANAGLLFQFAAVSGLTPLAVDEAANRVFYLVQSGATATLYSYDATSHVLRATLGITGLRGTAGSLIRCGGDRLAWRTTGGQLFIARLSDIPSAEVSLSLAVSNPVVLAHQPITLQWQLSNAGPAATTVTVSNRLPGFASFTGGSAAAGSVFLANGSVIWALPSLASNAASTATVQLLFTNNADLLVTNWFTSFTGLPDPLASNNSVALIFPVLADNNHNGLGDTWELGNFGGAGAAPGADADGDGFSNGQEFLAGTDPLDPSNLLRVTGLTVSSNSVGITFFAVRGQSYAIQKSESVTGPWIDFRIVSGESARLTTTENSVFGPAFYRVRRLP